jgi:16S rRNA (guanine527-N7)-methyltransferase
MDPDFAALVAAHLDPALEQTLAEVGASVPDVPALRQELARFCAALAIENRRLNLTGIVDPEGMAVRHVLDSLIALPACAGDGPLVDLGSGCGVPGIPLALALPGREVLLVESRQRKAAALSRLVETLGLAPRVTAVHARGEAWLAEHRVDLVVTRAVGSVDAQLKLLRNVKDAMGRLVLLKGPATDEELAAAEPRRERQGWPLPQVQRAELPGGAGQRTVLVYDLDGAATNEG